MAICAEVVLSMISQENRWGAEFYDPKFLKPLNKAYKWVRIGKILNMCQYGLSRAMNDEGIGKPIYRMNEIENLFLSEPQKFVRVDDKEYREFRLSKDDILFNRTNSFEFVGRTGILKHSQDAVFASYLVRIRPDRNLILPEFLTVYLNTKFGVGQIKRRAMPSINQTNVSASELKRIPIPLLPMPKQEQIAALVNNAAAHREDAKTLYRDAEESLEVELGLDKLKITHPVGYEARLSEIRAAKRFDGEYFKPSFRQVVKCVTNYRYGYEPLLRNVQEIRPNVDPSQQPEKTFQYVELADINASLGLVMSASEVLGKEAPSRARRTITKDDVIISAVAGSIDKAALVGEKYANALASTGFFQFRSDVYNPRFLLVLLRCRSTRMQLEREATGGILSAVSQRRLRHVVIPIIPKELQDEIAQKVGESHAAYREAETLLEKAKRCVEELIEQEAK